MMKAFAEQFVIHKSRGLKGLEGKRIQNQNRESRKSVKGMKSNDVDFGFS